MAELDKAQDLHDKLMVYSALYWADKIKLLIGGQPFNIKDHPFQIEPLNSRNRVEVFKCGTQIMKTTVPIIKRIHRLIHGEYPQGSMFIFPTTKLVRRFSQSRFSSLIADNPEIKRHIQDTDNLELKRVGKSNLHFIGAKVAKKIEGAVETSAALKSEPADNINFDEFDEIDGSMVDMALHRMDHSEIKEEGYSSSPSLPDFGIDQKYQESDQRVWMIKCQKCGTRTCLEIEFPNCIVVNDDGTAYRKCKKCGGVIYPRDGEWVAQVPGRDIWGWWISRLNLADKYVNLADIVKRFNDPPNGNIGDVYNHDLGIAYVAAENRLTHHDLWECLTNEVMRTSHPGPTAMGVDVGKMLHVVILDRPSDARVRLVKAVRVSKFEDLHDLARNFNVRSCVIDVEPESRKVYEFRDNESFEVFGCDYNNNRLGGAAWDSKLGRVVVSRTEVLDATHDIVVKRRLMLPRKNDEIEEFIKEYCNVAKKLEIDDDTGSREYKYLSVGNRVDHYRHATNYAFLAAGRIGIYVSETVKRQRLDIWDQEDSPSHGSYMRA